MTSSRDPAAVPLRPWLVRPGRAGGELLALAAGIWLLYALVGAAGGREALPVLSSVSAPTTRVVVLAALTELLWLCTRLLTPALVLASLPFLSVWAVRRVRAARERP